MQLVITHGPFVYQGTMHGPVQGWTNHHSTLRSQTNGIFYHDIELSGKTHLRNVKFTTFCQVVMGVLTL